ncbi:MAG: two-component system, OmpR family, sensor kinase [Solirubrobacteraceae bacterium]|nr:two-component system, OmpR family, sensor kinase [Solirubrobacteraceae bacterium]
MLVVADVALARSVDSFLLSQVDRRLESASPTVSRGGRYSKPSTVPDRPGGGHGGDPSSHDQPPPDDGGQVGLTDFWIETRDASGNVVDRISPGLPADSEPGPQLSAETVAAHARAPAKAFTIAAQSGTSQYRVKVDAQPDNRGYTVVALSLHEMNATSSRVLIAAGGVTLAVVLVLGLVAWWVLRLGVRPLGRMAATADAIATGDLSHRVDVKEGERTEVGRLGTAFNTMLTEIEDAFAAREQSEARLRRFVADASHELRTPLTSIRGYAELYRQGALSKKAEMADAMRRIESEASRMGVMVEDLLVLARMDQGRPLDKAPVDLGRVVADAVTDARAVEPERPISLDSSDGLVVVGDENRLRQVAANLLANVRVHTPPDTPAHVRVWRSDNWIGLEVSDEGPGIDPAVRSRVFERFFRADPSRARKSGGSGLGLSIVAAIAEAHGGRARVGDGARGASIIVELPAPAVGATGAGTA